METHSGRRDARVGLTLTERTMVAEETPNEGDQLKDSKAVKRSRLIRVIAVGVPGQSRDDTGTSDSRPGLDIESLSTAGTRPSRKK